MQKFFLVLLFWGMESAFAYTHCSQVKVTGDACDPSAIEVSLEGCHDTFVGMNRPKCSKDKIRFLARGKIHDYHIVLVRSASSWDQKTWNILSEREFPHTSPRKTLQPTQNERAPIKSATILVEEAQKDAPPKVTSAFTFSGYVDLYFQHNFNRPRPSSSLTSPQTQLRYYDWYSDQIHLALAEITIKHVKPETAFLLDLDFGSFADQNVAVATTASSGGHSFTISDGVTKHIGQAIFSYTPASAPGWIFDFGKMPTHVGLELMKARDNWNYSRSTLFSFGGPFWNTGAHVGYSGLGGGVTLGGYIYNGWGTNLDSNFTPTLGTQIKWTPTDRLTWIYNFIGGPETVGSVGEFYKQVHETNISYSLTPTLSIASDFLYGHQVNGLGLDTSAEWFGAQLGLKWQTSTTYFVSPRIEYFRDLNGFALGGPDQALMALTITNSYQISEGLDARLEGRWDHSTQADRFKTRDGVSANQPTVLLALLYSM